jgi:outer membrane lipoprotein-sorting protein
MITAALCAAALASPVFAARNAEPVTIEDVVKKVQEQQRKTNTLQAEFTQEKELALLAKPEVSSGTFVYSKPNSVLWNYDSPKRVTMLISKGMLTTYYPELNKAETVDVRRFEDRIFKYLGMSGAIDELARYFDFTFTDNAANPAYILDLTPKSKVVARRVRHIKIWIDKQTYLTNRIEYVEGDGDATRYAFRNIRINQPIEQNRFTLNLPPTVRVESMKLQ